MRNVVLGLSALVAYAISAAPASAMDLEILDPQIAQAFAQALCESADEIEDLQVKVEPDLEKACGVFMDVGEPVGLIIVPQTDITPENEAVNSDPGGAAGHLFMSKGFAPVIDDKPVDDSKMRTITFEGQDGLEQKVCFRPLASLYTDDAIWQLSSYGPDNKPLLDVEIGEGVGPGTQPIALEVKDMEDGTGTAYVTFFDMYQTNFKLNYKHPE
mgnify:FL=1